MSEILLINKVVEWERRLQWENEKHRYHRLETYAGYVADPRPDQKEHVSILARIFRIGKRIQPIYSTEPAGMADCPSCSES